MRGEAGGKAASHLIIDEAAISEESDDLLTHFCVEVIIVPLLQ